MTHTNWCITVSSVTEQYSANLITYLMSSWKPLSSSLSASSRTKIRMDPTFRTCSVISCFTRPVQHWYQNVILVSYFKYFWCWGYVQIYARLCTLQWFLAVDILAMQLLHLDQISITTEMHTCKVHNIITYNSHTWLSVLSHVTKLFKNHFIKILK